MAYSKHPMAVRSRARYAANTERHLAYSRTYRKRHPEKILNSGRDYYAANRDAINATSRARYAANPEPRSAQGRAYNKRNPEKTKARWEACGAKRRATAKAQEKSRAEKLISALPPELKKALTKLRKSL